MSSPTPQNQHHPRNSRVRSSINKATNDNNYTNPITTSRINSSDAPRKTSVQQNLRQYIVKPNIAITTPSELETQAPKENQQGRHPTTDTSARQTTINFPQTSHQSSPDKTWGDSPSVKSANHVRFFFQNVNGLPFGHPHQAIIDALTPLHELEPDYIGLAETNLDFTKPNIRYATSNGFKKIFDRSTKLSFSTSSLEFKSSYKPGGTLTAAVGSWCSRVSDSDQDQHGLGRWSFQILRSKSNQHIAVVTAYRVCQNSDSGVPGPLTAFTQQRTILRATHANPNPKIIWDEHFRKQLQQWRDMDYDIIVMMDANDSLHASSKLTLYKTLQEFDLVDAFHATHPDPPPSPTNDPIITYQRGSKRLDYILVSRRLRPSIAKCGYLPFSQCIQSDHRGIFMDLDKTNLFGNHQPILPAEMRKLTTKHPKKVEKYLEVLRDKFLSHNVEERSITLYDKANNTNAGWTPIDQARYNALDRDITRAMLTAEKHCGGKTHSTPWSPTLTRAGKTVQYWNLRRKQIKFHFQYDESLMWLRTEYNIDDSDERDIDYIHEKLTEARATLAQIRKKARSTRDAHLQALAEQEGKRHKMNPAIIATRILIAERQQEIFRKLHFVLKRNQHSGLTRLKVPKEACHPNSHLPNSAEDNYPATSEEWVTIENRPLVEAHLIARNNTHYRQANNTPFGHTERSIHLGFDGTGPTAANILDGNYAHDLGNLQPETVAYIKAMKHPRGDGLPAEQIEIATSISVADLVHGFSKWPEKTSTSPSGLHLGHYRSFLYDVDDEGRRPSMEILQRMINIPLMTGIPPDRWLTASSVCLEKEKDNPQTDKIRIIHLYEADLNLVWKLLWGLRLVRNAEKHSLYPDAQYGSRPGRNAPDAVLCKQLCYEISRTTRTNMALLDNDAIANFDRIVCSLSSVACQRLGMPAITEKLHNDILLRMCYNVKTGYGTSTATYGASPTSPIQGQGQGSGNAPSCWGAVSTPMWAALKELCDQCFTAFSADLKTTCNLQGIAFVDDATNLLNDIGRESMDEATLVTSLQTLAQTWERLVYSSGGALKPSKCFWFAVTWQWASGFPILRSKNKYTNNLTIRDSNNNTDVVLQMKGPVESERTLGIRISPSGSQLTEMEWLTKKAESFATLIQTGNLTREEAYRAYHSIYIPGISYPLGVTHLSRTQAKRIQKRAIQPILASMGVNRNMHRAVVYGPPSHGGLGFRCISTEQGIQQIEHLVGHLRLGDTIGKLIEINLSLHQLTAGISLPLLASPHVKVPYLTKGWFTSIREFLSSIHASIEINNLCTLLPCRDNDKLLMDLLNDDSVPPGHLDRLNHCRLYLQVLTLSDICTADGLQIKHCAFHGRSIEDSSSAWHWPRQERPPAQSWTIWQSTLRRHFLEPKKGLSLRPAARLGAWLPTAHTHHRQPHLRIDTATGDLWQTLPCGNFRHYASLGLPHEDGRYRVSNRTPTTPPTAQISPDIPLTPASLVIATSHAQVLQACTAAPPAPTGEDSPANPSPAQTFEMLLNTRLPAWEKRILTNVTELDDMRSRLGTTEITMACDGSVIEGNGSFGWAIGSESTTYWEGNGPADGSPLCMSSQRAELTGMLAGLRFLHHFALFHNITHCSRPVVIVCDNKSAIGYATPPHSPTSAIQSNSPDYDLTRSIHDTITLLPFKVELKWVKGHQDSKKPFDSLSREAQLNVIADSLASEFHNSEDQTLRSRPNTPPPPMCRASLLIRNHRITSNHKQHLREASLLPALIGYIIQRNDWHPDTWHSVDWASHSRAVHGLTISQRLTITKFQHRWLPTNHNLRKQTPSLSPTCSLCQVANDDDNHMCHCDDDDAVKIRSSAANTLRKLLGDCGTDPILQSILLEGIHTWFASGNDMCFPNVPHDHPFSAQLHQAVVEQNAIGWSQLCRGRLSLAWGECYRAWLNHLHTPPGTKHLDMTTWTTQIARWGFDTVLQLWKNRNTKIHQRTETHLFTARHLLAQAHVRDRHSIRPADLSSGDVNALFSEPLPELLLRPPHVLETWVAHVDRIYIRHRNEVLQRSKRCLITTYFSRASQRSSQTHQSPDPQ
jgi:hypothetical protein